MSSPEEIDDISVFALEDDSADEWLPTSDELDKYSSEDSSHGVPSHPNGKKPETRPIDLENANLDIDSFLEGSKSCNSKKAEKQAVKLFNDTMSSLNETRQLGFKPIDECPLDELANQLCQFFLVVTKKDGKVINASSLTAHHIALARYLAQRKENQVDIKADSRFKEVSAVLKARCTQVASKGARPGINAAKAVPTEVLSKTLAEGHMGRESPRALITLIHFNLMTGFGCRALQVCLIKLSHAGSYSYGIHVAGNACNFK